MDRRFFLGWEKPFCETVAEHVLDGAQNDLPDLGGLVVIVPTRQAGYRLREALALAAEKRGVNILGPEIKTASAMLFPDSAANIANAAQSLAVWDAVLSAVKPGEFSAFLGESDSVRFNLQTARRLEKLRAELSDGGYAISSVAEKNIGFAEPERWAQMAELERRFRKLLGAHSLRDQTEAKIENARCVAQQNRHAKIMLAANPDPPKILLALLENRERNGTEVEVLVGAPESEAALFDAWGCPDPATWEKRGIGIAEDSIVLAANPEAEAEFIVDAVRGRARPQSGKPMLAVGVPDRETVAPLLSRLEEAGLPAFDPQRRPFANTPLCRLVKCLLALKSNADYEAVAALLRHPYVLEFFGDAAVLLRDLDGMQSERIPVTLDDILDRPDKRRSAPNFIKLAEWRGELRNAVPHIALRRILREIFKEKELDAGSSADRDFEAAADVLNGIFEEFESDAAMPAGVDVGAVFAARLADASVEPSRRDEPVDLEGWLELAWNPAPLMFVAGMNEGCVPDGTLGDVFLPDSLRKELGLRDDRARMARDAYVLQAILAQRGGAGVFLLVAKTSASGDPLLPSRLLFKCPDSALTARAKTLFKEMPPAANAAPFNITFKLDPFQNYAAADLRSSKISPTAFGAYLNSPLLYWFSRVLGMRKSDDLRREPDAMQFGNIVHHALNRMALDENKIWACGNAGSIAGFLEKEVAKFCGEQYGEAPWFGVSVAKESAVMRLRAFAQAQVEWHGKGWDIVECESDKRMEINGMTVSGRCDRIDYNRIEKRHCVLDYKTGKEAKSPQSAHLGAVKDEHVLFDEMRIDVIKEGKPVHKTWLDLQLPLYVELLAREGKSEVAAAYVNIPADPGKTGFHVWDDYNGEIHASAMKCAAKTIGEIRAGNFAIPGRMNYADEFEGLLLGDPEKTIVLNRPNG